MHSLHRSNLFREACYINGKWQAANSAKQIPVLNPCDGQVIGHVPQCEQIETERAIIAAHNAYLDWRAHSAKERSDFMMKWALLIDENKEDLARIMTYEQGKPLTESLNEIDYSNAFIKWFAEEARRVYGDVIPSNKKNQRLLVIKQAVGVVGAITPWNFPSAMITRKIAPALAAGCTAVVKPDIKTPFSAFALAVLAEQAGIPAGVFNVITGDAKKIGAELTGNPLVRKISFTGSTAVGKLLMQQCAASVKKISLELGGNAPFIVFDDANIDQAVAGAIASKFRNTGQTCVCANRILVQDSIYAAFTKKLIQAVQQLKTGNGFDANVQLGPLINEAALNKVKAHLTDAVQKGGQIIYGGKPHPLGGLFFEPTILTEANSAMRLAQEETFGPVAPLFRFHDEEEAIKLANDTDYGLASYFYSENNERIWRVAESLEYGMIGINTGIISTEVAPFGGIKQSGMGREGSKYGMDAYVELKYLCMGSGS